MQPLTRPLTLLLAALAATGCSRAEAVRSEGPTVLHVNAADYAFTAPDTVRGGLITVRLHNTGTEVHHAQLVRIDAGKTFAEFAAMVAGGGHGPWPAWVRQIGGPNAVEPNDSTDVTLALPSGRYAFICLIPSPDGVPHFAKGMLRAFEVVPGGVPVPPARADLVMVLDDYRFDLSAALRAGRQTIEVTNAASQPHEVVLVALAEGSTAQDLLAWVANGEQGPAPGRFIGGTVGLDRGERNWLTLDLVRGTYALLCFLPDAGDGRMHLEHGMVREIVVN